MYCQLEYNSKCRVYNTKITGQIPGTWDQTNGFIITWILHQIVMYSNKVYFYSGLK